MKVPDSNEKRCKDNIISSLEFLDYEKMKFLKRVAIGLVNLSVSQVVLILSKDPNYKEESVDKNDYFQHPDRD